MTEKPENHKVLIVRIPEPRVHTNADTLELFDILGYQLVAKKGNYKPGDLAVYIQPDSVVPQTAPFAWLWEGKAEGDVTERNRRITVRKFHKEYSEGLLMPAHELGFLTVGTYGVVDPTWLRFEGLDIKEGDDVSDLLGITHWEGDKEQDTFGQASKAPRVKRRPNSIRGWLRYFYYNTLRFLTGGRMYRQESSMEVKFDAPEYDVVSQIVPILYHGPADIEMLKSLTDGKSVLDGKTQREGIVVSEESKAADGHRRPRQVKRVSNVFLEKDTEK